MTNCFRTGKTVILGALLILPVVGCEDDDDDPASPIEPFPVTVVIPDRGYEKNRIFNVTGEGGIRMYRSIDSIRVFVADDIQTNDNETGAIDAHAHLDGDPLRPAEPPYARFDQQVEGEDYAVNRTTGTLYMRDPVPEEYTLGVYYVLSGNEPIEQRRVGFLPAPEDAAPAGPDTTILKLIRPENPAPGVSQAEDPSARNTIFLETWQYQLRNYYDLHASSIQSDGFRVRILKRIPGQPEGPEIQSPDGTTFLRVLGLDNQGTTLGSPPDDQIDRLYENCNNNLPLTDVYLVDYDYGFIVFPGEQPFDPVPGQENVACNSDVTLLERNPTIYNTRYRDQDSSDEKYVIEVTYQTSDSE